VRRVGAIQRVEDAFGHMVTGGRDVLGGGSKHISVKRVKASRVKSGIGGFILHQLFVLCVSSASCCPFPLFFVLFWLPCWVAPSWILRWRGFPMNSACLALLEGALPCCLDQQHPNLHKLSEGWHCFKQGGGHMLLNMSAMRVMFRLFTKNVQKFIINLALIFTQSPSQIPVMVPQLSSLGQLGADLCLSPPPARSGESPNNPAAVR